MLNHKKQLCRVKPIFAYIKRAIKFYDTDNPWLARIVFLLELAVVFGGFVFSRPYAQDFSVFFEQFSVRIRDIDIRNFDISFIDLELYGKMIQALSALIVIFIVTAAISYVINLFYGVWYYLSLTDKIRSGYERVLIFLRRLPKILLFNLIFYLIFGFIVVFAFFIFAVAVVFIPFFSLLLMSLPILFFSFNALFVFKDLLIVEFNVGIFRNFKKSLELTKNCKTNIILNCLWPLFIGYILNSMAVYVPNPMLSLLVSIFINVIIFMVSQRLVVLMFIDAASLSVSGQND